MGGIGMPELLRIAAVVLIVFGRGKLPQLGRGLGEGIRDFRDAMRERERSGSTWPNAALRGSSWPPDQGARADGTVSLKAEAHPQRDVDR